MDNRNLSTLDRATLGAWSVGNTVGWSLGSIVVGIAMDLLSSILVHDVLDAAIDPLTGGAVLPDWLAGVVTALLVGGAMGAVIGSRVHRWPVITTVVVTVVFLAAAPFPIMLLRTWVFPSMLLQLLFAGLSALFFFRRAQRGAPQLGRARP